jgi:hypothetical protein
MGQRIVLTEHALGEARRRGISEATVLDVTANPQQRLPGRGRREIRRSLVADAPSGKLYVIRVIVERCGDWDEVVTVYRTSKVRKYWSGQ